MFFSIATNWDNDLIKSLNGTSAKSLYGQIWGDPLGGGRMMFFLPRVGKGEAAVFIDEALKAGIGFNYLLNATCLDNLEFTREGYRKIMEHLEWIASTGAEMVTVSLPFLLQLVKKEFGSLKVCVSSFVRIQNVQMARFWEDLGADKIVLPEIIARDFNALNLIRESVNCELELIANHCCLYFCPMDLHHRNMVSHGSQWGHPCEGFAADHCKLSCQRAKLLRPEELIKARWIRPEDVSPYEEIGIDCLKLVERFKTTESLIEIHDAYERRSYNGNLANLLALPKEGSSLMPNLDILDQQERMDSTMIRDVLAVLREPFVGKVVIDNGGLEGFLDFSKKTDCSHTDCNQCGYCKRVSSRTVTIDEVWRQRMIASFDRAVEALIDGSVAGIGGR